MRKLIFFVLIFVSFAMARAQEDSTGVAHITKQYSLSDDYTKIVPVVMDTILSEFQEYKVLDRHSPFYLSLGNYGLPIEAMDFFKRSIEVDEYLYRFYKPYMHHLGNKVYLDTQVPFTELVFTYGGAKAESEQTLQLRHSQNINRFLNFGLDLDVINSRGQYGYQSTDDRSFTLHSSYLGKRYQAFGSWTLNNIKGGENGGISDISQLGTVSTRDLPTNLGGLNNAESVFRYKDLLLIQKLIIGGDAKPVTDSTVTKTNSSVKGTFSHILSWENGKKIYSDDSPDGGFYDTTYITGTRNNVATFDSLYSRILRNTLRFDFTSGENKKFQMDIGVGIMNELNIFSQVRPLHDTLIFADTLSWKHSSNAIVGRLSNRIGDKFGWEADGKLYFSGYKAGDFNIKGRIDKTIGTGKWSSRLYGKGSFINQGPSFWQSSFGSNHFEWENDFDKELRINIGGGYKIPYIHLDISADYSLITNYLYFNRAAVPKQFEGSISVLALRFNKNFNFWKLRFNNRVLVQKSSHPDILDLPFIALKSSFYFDHTFNFKVTEGKLGFQLGVEGIYNTSYFSSSYMPATGAYYNQNQIETGNYPYINAFINLRLKRTRFFFSFEHLNQGMTIFGDNYAYVPGYLMPVRTFKYGIAWTFYN